MSKTTPNYVRQPAASFIEGSREQLQDQLIQSLIGLMGKHLPGMQPDLQQLTQQVGQVQAQLEEQQNQLVLQGHGQKGVLRSQSIKTAKDEAEFKALAPQPVENPADVNAILQLLNQYMTVQLLDEGKQAMVLPTVEIFGPLFHDVTATPNVDLTQESDGVYVVQTEQYAFYTIRIGLDKSTILLLSSNTGPTLATYSLYEEHWIQHRNWALVDATVTLKAIEKFFSKVNVHAPGKNEIKRLAEQLSQVVKDASQAKAVEELVDLGDFRPSGGQVFYLKLNDVFTMTVDPSGTFEVVATRKDISWDDMTQYTQRHLFESFQKRLAAASQGAKPVKAAKKAVTKKRR